MNHIGEKQGDDSIHPDLCTLSHVSVVPHARVYIYIYIYICTHKVNDEINRTPINSEYFFHFSKSYARMMPVFFYTLISTIYITQFPKQ